MAIISVLLLISISVIVNYYPGMVIGFLILVIFFSFERLKKIIIELHIKRIFGIEFDDIDSK